MSEFGESATQVEHGPAGDMPVFINCAVPLAKGAFGKLGRHAEQAADDHPEDGSRAADANGESDTRNVAETHGGGECSRECLEMRDLAGAAGLRIEPANAVDAVAKSAKIDELKAKSEEERTRDEPDDDDWELDGVARFRRVVPERQIEEDEFLDGGHDQLFEKVLGHGEEADRFGGGFVWHDSGIIRDFSRMRSNLRVLRIFVVSRRVD